jgi:hypothetical protein
MRIGISGHRPNRMHIGVALVEKRLAQVLRLLKRASRSGGSHRRRMVAVSALAEGSDRLFATAALDVGCKLVVLLPFPTADYETTFGDVSTTADYHALLKRAESVTELPGSLADSSAGYEAVGRATVDQTDVLVTVWDGKPSAGRGGTPEVLQYALDKGKTVIWIDASRDRPPLLLRTPTAGGWRSVPLATLARRARGVRLARLAAIRPSRG